jgi:hypothetical protein
MTDRQGPVSIACRVQTGPCTNSTFVGQGQGLAFHPQLPRPEPVTIGDFIPGATSSSPQQQSGPYLVCSKCCGRTGACDDGSTPRGTAQVILADLVLHKQGGEVSLVSLSHSLEVKLQPGEKARLARKWPNDYRTLVQFDNWWMHGRQTPRTPLHSTNA